MPNKTFNTRIRNKRDTAANWETVASTFQPLDGEMIIVYTADGATRFKVGRYDSVKGRLLYYNELPFTDESLGNKIYTQNEEPVDAADGALWVDLDEISSSPSIIPRPTSENNGKYLGCEDGVAKWMSVAASGIDIPTTLPNPNALTFTGAVNASYDGSSEVNVEIPDTLDKMDKNNPTGTGSFSLNRKAGSTVGDYSHAEGRETTASGHYSHAEGSNATASGKTSHAEGDNTTASGYASHVEGDSTTASGEVSHAEGIGTTASGWDSHTEGCGTKASSSDQHVQGKYNIEDSSNVYADIIGNGTSSKPSNAATVDWSGNAWFAGDVYVGSTSGTNKDEGSKKLATEEYVNNNIPSGIEIPTTLPNPNPLTFTGAVEGTYDGSNPLTVEIPSGDSIVPAPSSADNGKYLGCENGAAAWMPVEASGGTDVSLGLTSVKIGQTIKVKAVDENGKPTEWEAAELYKNLPLIFSRELTEPTTALEIYTDSEGNALSLNEWDIFVHIPGTTTQKTKLYVYVVDRDLSGATFTFAYNDQTALNLFRYRSVKHNYAEVIACQYSTSTKSEVYMKYYPEGVNAKSIRMYTYNEPDIIPAGTIVEVYGK